MTTMLARLSDALADRYRLERELGAGGMATVYLAQDLRHDRLVAVKVLRPELAAVIGAERFLAEIKTTANLQHPHILPLFDSGVADSFLYYVMPYVEGISLRDRMTREKQLPIQEAVRIASEVAGALDYAHRHGVIHRDIKPENILLHDGSALVADFGIALAASKAGSRMTETGMSLGTPQYMSPEQAMGERELDARSDVYALGCVTYEMLTGEPPFTGPTAQAIVAKVMTAEPAEATTLRKTIPPAVADAVHTALQKLPADRFASAAEFATALAGERTTTRRAIPPRAAGWSRAPRIGVGAAALGLLALGFVGGGRLGHREAAAPLRFSQRTFHDQGIIVARFAPDGKTIVYSSPSGNFSPAVFVLRPDYAEPTPLGLPDTHLLSISSKGELAVLVRPAFVLHRIFQGTLARVPLGGGAPREVLDSVREADWSPDGSELAIIHGVNGRDRLEFPIGKVLYQASGYLSEMRVSPDGKQLAFAEHPWRWDDRGTVRIIDRAGKTVAVTRGFESIEGLAWHPSGREVFFSSVGTTSMIVYAFSPGGELREAVSSTGDLTAQDVGPGGQLLLTRDDWSYHLLLHSQGSNSEVDVSWLNSSFGPFLSHDGTLLAYANGGFDAGPNYAVMLQRTDGGKVARLGDGWPTGFSRDGKWLLAVVASTPPRVTRYPVGAGAERPVDVGTFESIGSADWFPDGQSILVCGNHVKEPSRCYVQSLAGGTPRAVTPEGTHQGLVSPDGKEVAAFGDALGHRRYPLDGDGTGAGENIPGLSASDRVRSWAPDGRALLIDRGNSHTVERLDLATGRREPALQLGAGRSGTLWYVNSVALADDPHTYAYVAVPYVSQLFTVDGVR